MTSADYTPEKLSEVVAGVLVLDSDVPPPRFSTASPSSFNPWVCVSVFACICGFLTVYACVNVYLWGDGICVNAWI